MSMVSEFKEFVNKGNVMDLAVGVIIGARLNQPRPTLHLRAGVVAPPPG